MLKQTNIKFKRRLTVAALIAAAITAIVPIASVSAANGTNWGPSRKTYTMKNPANEPTFNSITDNNIVGNETNFVRVAESGSKTAYADSIKVVPGKEYVVWIFYHNDAKSSLNESGKGIARGVRVTTGLTSWTVNSSKPVKISGVISATNTNPLEVWDEAILTTDSQKDVVLKYVEGSAKYTNSKMGTVALSNNIINSAVTLGYEKLDGKIPGCYQYDGQVTIQVKIHKSVTAKLAKTVRLKGAKGWNESVEAKIGDEVEFQIEYVNLTSAQVNNVMIRDVLPTNLEYVKDSTVLYNSNYQNGTKVVENTLTTSGINIGSYGVNGNAYVRFTAKVVNKSLACGNNQLVNWASSTVDSKVTKDDASVMVKRDDDKCHEQPTPPTPPTPPVIPQTGATEVTAIALGAGSVVTVAGYAIASWKKR